MLSLAVDAIIRVQGLNGTGLPSSEKENTAERGSHLYLTSFKEILFLAVSHKVGEFDQGLDPFG